MSPSRPPRPRLNRERLLLLGALAVFVAGSAWVARGTPRGPSAPRTWIGALPSVGLPLLQSLLRR